MRRRRVTTESEPVRRDPVELRAEADAAEQAARERAETILEAAEVGASGLRARAAEIDEELIAEREAAELALEQESARAAYASALAEWAAALQQLEDAEAARSVVEDRQRESDEAVEERRTAREVAVAAGATIDVLAEVQEAVDRAEALRPRVASQLQRAEQTAEQCEAVVATARAAVEDVWRELEDLGISGEYSELRPPWLPVPKPTIKEFLRYVEQERPELFGYLAAQAAFDAYAALLPDEPTPKPKSRVSVVRQ